MDDALVQATDPRHRASEHVLILVVMDDALVLSEISDFEAVEFMS